MEAKIHKPVLIVIAGPNGSGKTTITSRVLHHEWLEDSIYQPRQYCTKRAKNHPSPRHHNTYPSSYSQHLFSWFILRRYSAIYRRYFRILRRYSAIFRSNFRVNEFRNSYHLTSGRANSLPPTPSQTRDYQSEKQRINFI